MDTASPVAANPRLPEREAGELAVLSLFDGVGTTALTVASVLRQQGAFHRCSRIWAVEVQDHLREAVSRWWRTQRRLCGGPLVEPLAADAWDLLRGRGAALAPLLRELPPGSLLLIVAGSPCQQLSPFSQGRGAVGLCGPDSCLFFLVPILRRLITTWRPDVTVHAVVENAGEMHQRFRDAILRCLGLNGRLDHAPVVNSRSWSRFNRCRTFFSTLPPAPRADAAGVARRRDPWDEG